MRPFVKSVAEEDCAEDIEYQHKAPGGYKADHKAGIGGIEGIDESHPHKAENEYAHDRVDGAENRLAIALDCVGEYAVDTCYCVEQADEAKPYHCVIYTHGVVGDYESRPEASRQEGENACKARENDSIAKA